MNSNICSKIFRKRLLIEAEYTAEIKNEKFLADFFTELSHRLSMHIINGPFICSAVNKENPLHEGYEAQVVWEESGVSVYTWAKYNFCTVDIYTCKDFDTQNALEFVKEYFGIIRFSYYELPDPLILKEDSRIEIRQTNEKGAGMFATDFIPKGTTISYIDGPILFAKKESEIEPYARNHAVPFHKFFYRNGFNGTGTRLNHSCDPNCYIKDLFFVTTMKDIEKDEELTYSYSLFCNSDWENPEGACHCGANNCFGKILPWRDLPKDYKIKYLDYTADWILFDEMKKNNLLDSLKKIIN